MEYVDEIKTFDISDFEAWGGAKDVIKQAKKVHRLDELEALVEGAFDGYEEMITATMINDYIWFYANDELNLWDEDED